MISIASKYIQGTGFIPITLTQIEENNESVTKQKLIYFEKEDAIKIFLLQYFNINDVIKNL